MRTVDRIIATSDLHGQEKKFLSLLKKAQYDSDKDLLVVCGDMIDRGEQNLDCLATCEDLQKKGAVLLKGNHEQFLEQSLKEMVTSDIWRSCPSENLNNWVRHNGGESMYHEIKDLSTEKLTEILKFVQNLPTYFAAGNFIFSHAGANTLKPIEDNIENELVWMEEAFPVCPAYKNKVMIFGHVPTWLLCSFDANKRKGKNYRKTATIWFDDAHKDKVGIDCGGVFGGRLAALELPSYREFYE